MKILFIGGTGTISSACSQLVFDRGMDLYHLNRGKSARPAVPGTSQLIADIRQPEIVRKVIRGMNFDVVVDWVAYTPDHVQSDLDLLRDITGQYIFISSAFAYQKPLLSWLIPESTVLNNPYWKYARNKIACEELLLDAY